MGDNLSRPTPLRRGFTGRSYLNERKNRVAEELHVTPLAVTKLCRRGAEAVGVDGEILLRRLEIVC